MKRTALAAILGLALALPAQAQVKDRAVAVAQSDVVVTVTKVDAKARKVTFRDPGGAIATLTVPAEAQNLDQVKPGQQYRMKFVRAVAVEISKGGAPGAMATEDVKLSPKGAKPGGVIVHTVQIAGVIDAIDHANRQLAVRGPKGNVVSLTAADDVNLDPLSAGDRVSVVHTEALAIEMVAKPAAKKAPAKKAAEKKSI